LFREWNEVEFPKIKAFREFRPSFPKQLSCGHFEKNLIIE
jgi:hypothetical protein